MSKMSIGACIVLFGGTIVAAAQIPSASLLFSSTDQPIETRSVKSTGSFNVKVGTKSGESGFVTNARLAAATDAEKGVATVLGNLDRRSFQGTAAALASRIDSELQKPETLSDKFSTEENSLVSSPKPVEMPVKFSKVKLAKIVQDHDHRGKAAHIKRKKTRQVTAKRPIRVATTVQPNAREVLKQRIKKNGWLLGVFR